jgi:hypothetical protein
MIKKPSVKTKCVANYYAHPQERIIEYSFRDKASSGGLISFVHASNGELHVTLYRQDPNIHIHVHTTQEE